MILNILAVAMDEAAHSAYTDDFYTLTAPDHLLQLSAVALMVVKYSNRWWSTGLYMVIT